jgi:hypothetical protein
MCLQFIQIVVPQYHNKFYVEPDKQDLATYENAIFKLFRPKQEDNFVVTQNVWNFGVCRNDTG